MPGMDDMNVQMQIDEMKRVILNRRYYNFGPLGQYSLVIALPEKLRFWNVEHTGEDGLFRQVLKSLQLNTKFRNWTLHPYWYYCHIYDTKFQPESSEDEMLVLLDYLSTQKNFNEVLEKYCDTKLVKSFFADLKMTEWFDSNIFHTPKL